MNLLYKMTNSNNVTSIVDKLITHLKAATEAHFRKDLVMKITSLSYLSNKVIVALAKAYLLWAFKIKAFKAS